MLSNLFLNFLLNFCDSRHHFTPLSRYPPHLFGGDLHIFNLLNSLPLLPHHRRHLHPFQLYIGIFLQLRRQLKLVLDHPLLLLHLSLPLSHFLVHFGNLILLVLIHLILNFFLFLLEVLHNFISVF